MATFSDITRVGGSAWKFTPVGTAPFNYYLRGKLIIPLSLATSVVVNHPEGSTTEPPALEVIDSTETDLPDSTQYPGYLTIQWEQVDEAEYYLVQRTESAAWVDKAQVRESGLGYYKHTTGTIPDGSSEAWRVVAVDSDGNDSEALSMTFTMICHPDPPDIELSYELITGVGYVTVSAV